MISVQTKEFDHCQEYQKLRDKAQGDGAIVTFTGLVRDFNNGSFVSAIQLEHYPGMTEKTLLEICSQAQKRWTLGQITVIHRVGVIAANEQIVFVGVTSKHRNNAFEACQFIMDVLKTQAPLWKQETTTQGIKWVEPKPTDEESANKWASKN